jgi:hypothetical protein
MTASAPRDRHERMETCSGFKVRIVSYALFDRYYASADDVDPGAVIARGSGATREEAESEVLAKAKDRMARTRRFPLDEPAM